MEKFARIVVGYHGCARRYADALLTGQQSVAEWQRSQNAYDWLGEGVYFWEYSAARAADWAREQHGDDGAVIGALIQLGACYDLLDGQMAAELVDTYSRMKERWLAEGKELPKNRGPDKKMRELDCAVINQHMDLLKSVNVSFDTVRGAFLEGPAAFPGTTISAQTHIQIAVRNVDCILGIFRPNL